jgi:hypothetical protein
MKFKVFISISLLITVSGQTFGKENKPKKVEDIGGLLSEEFERIDINVTDQGLDITTETSFKAGELVEWSSCPFNFNHYSATVALQSTPKRYFCEQVAELLNSTPRKEILVDLEKRLKEADHRSKSVAHSPKISSLIFCGPDSSAYKKATLFFYLENMTAGLRRKEYGYSYPTSDEKLNEIMNNVAKCFNKHPDSKKIHACMKEIPTFLGSN